MDRLSELASKCRQGLTSEEWGELLGAVHSGIVLALRAMCGKDETLLDDFTQETMVKAVRHRSSFAGNTFTEFRAWCVKIAARVAVDHYRKAGVKKLSIMDPAAIQRLREASTDSDSGSAALSADASRALEIVKGLGSPCRELLTLHYLNGLDYADIALLTGKTYDAVRVSIIRCRHAARKSFEG